MPQGSKIASGERRTHAPRMPAEMAPMTSNGFPEISQALLALASARVRKYP